MLRAPLLLALWAAAAGLTDAEPWAAASAKADARLREAFVRQRATRRRPRVDRATAEASLRLAMRADTGRLKLGRRWRPYPTDADFARESAEYAKELEELAGELGLVRSWGCGYERERDRLFAGRLTALSRSGTASLAEQPRPPALTELERLYRHGPTPPPLEPEPDRAEDSVPWLDAQASVEIDAALSAMRLARSKDPKATVFPDEERLAEAIRLWRRAAAFEKGGRPGPDLPASRYAESARAVAGEFSHPYGRAPHKKLLDCAVGERLFDLVGREAKRLLQTP